MDRRNFLKKVVGAGAALALVATVKPTEEVTVETDGEVELTPFNEDQLFTLKTGLPARNQLMP